MPRSSWPVKKLAIAASYAPSLINFREALLKAAVAGGHRVLCLAPDFTPDIEARLRALGCETAGFPLQRTGLNPLEDVRSFRALRSIFADWKPDVVTGYTPKAAIYSATAARKARVPRVAPMITGLGYAFLKEQGLKLTAVRHTTKALYRWAFHCSDAAIFHNHDDLRQLRSDGLIPARLSTHVVGGSGVDLARFREAPLPALADGLVFLMVARLVRYKGVFEFCEAARLVRERGGRARFVLIGPEEGGPVGLTAEKLEAFAGIIEYLGPRDDIAEQMARAHVYVLPSYGEGMPRTVLEALAVGRPVITTDVHGCRDTVEPGVNGLLVPPRDVEALAGAMESMLRRPDLIPAMAAASRARAEQRFSVEGVVRETLAALGLVPPNLG